MFAISKESASIIHSGKCMDRQLGISRFHRCIIRRLVSRSRSKTRTVTLDVARQLRRPSRFHPSGDHLSLLYRKSMIKKLYRKSLINSTDLLVPIYIEKSHIKHPEVRFLRIQVSSALAARIAVGHRYPCGFISLYKIVRARRACAARARPTVR